MKSSKEIKEEFYQISFNYFYDNLDLILDKRNPIYEENNIALDAGLSCIEYGHKYTS